MPKERPLTRPPSCRRCAGSFQRCGIEFAPLETDWRRGEHASELVVPLLKAGVRKS